MVGESTRFVTCRNTDRTAPELRKGLGYCMGSPCQTMGRSILEGRSTGAELDMYLWRVRLL